MMYSPFNPPSADVQREINDLHKRIRCFDANLRARANGYDRIGYDLCDLPVVDPHGTPWSLLTDAELRRRREWCMLPEMHDALQREMRLRR